MAKLRNLKFLLFIRGNLPAVDVLPQQKKAQSKRKKDPWWFSW